MFPPRRRSCIASDFASCGTPAYRRTSPRSTPNVTLPPRSPVATVSRATSRPVRDDERETKTPRKVVDPSQVQVLADAQAIADEWVTATRLDHVLDKFGPATMADTSKVIAAMVADVVREAGVANEIVDSKAARAAIGKRAAAMFHARLKVTR